MISKKVRLTILKQLVGKANSTTIASSCYLGLINNPDDTHVDSSGNPTVPTYTEAPASLEVGGGSYSTGYERTLLGNYNVSDTQKINVRVIGTVPTAINDTAIYTCECLDHTDIPGYPENPWGTLEYFGIFTAKTGGELIAWGKIKNEEGVDSPITPEAKQIPVVRVGQLQITIEEAE